MPATIAHIRSDMGLKGTLQEQGLVIETSTNREEIREYFGKLENDQKKTLGEIFGKLVDNWSSGNIEGRVP